MSAKADDYRWPGSVGGAIAAKVIGEHCAGSIGSPEIAELDVNPLLVTSDGATALDARILAGCCARARELLGDSYDLEALESACERARQLLAPTPARLPSAEPDDLA